MKKIWQVIKRFWWLILTLVAFLLGTQVKKKKNLKLKADLEEIKRRKEEELKQLEKELERLKEEEKAIYEKQHFKTVEDAIEYLNDVLRKNRR